MFRGKRNRRNRTALKTGHKTKAQQWRGWNPWIRWMRRLRAEDKEKNGSWPTLAELCAAERDVKAVMLQWEVRYTVDAEDK